MAKKKIPQSAYGTELSSADIRSNHPIRSKYMAATLAIIFGIFGINHFYLRNIVRGLLMLLLTAVCVVLNYLFAPPFIVIPIILSVFQGLFYLIQSDASFMKKNHVRVV